LSLLECQESKNKDIITSREPKGGRCSDRKPVLCSLLGRKPADEEVFCKRVPQKNMDLSDERIFPKPA
jgi:hypothetical protein